MKESDFSSISWEQRKLGDVFEEYSEKGHPELPALTIIQGGGTIRRDESDRSLQYDKASLANYKMVNADDFIVHLRSFEGGLEKATTLGIISPAYHTLHGEGTDSRFYYSYFRSKKFIDQELKPHVYGIRDGRSIDIEGMKTIEIPWTSYNEQQAIGNYIDMIDCLITLHQRKLFHIEIDCFCLRMIAWEQRKLGELAVFSKGMGYSKSDLKESGTPIILYGRLYTKYETIIHKVDTFADAKSGSAYSEGGEVIVPASGETAEDISIASVVEKPGILLGGDLNIIHPKGDVDPTFLAISISNGTPHIDMARRAHGKSVVHLHNEDLSQIELRYPSLAEQQKIGHYFSSLDHLITFYQRELEKLQNIKKSMLEKMFV